MHSPIGFVPFVNVLHEANAPKNIISYYTKLIEDPEEKFEISLKTKQYNISIDSLIQLKDRNRLISFTEQVISKVKEMDGAILFSKANKAIKNDSFWK